MNSARRIVLLSFAFATVLAATAHGGETLEPVFGDPEYQLTGVVVTSDSRIFVNYPYWQNKHKYSVVEVEKDGTAKPYPDEAWNSFKKGEDGKSKFVCVQARLRR